MATKAKAAKGTALKRGDGGGTEVFTTIGEVTTFSGPERSLEMIEATSHDSTAKEYVAGLVDNGTVSFDFNFVGSNTQQQGLDADQLAGTLRNFKLVLPDHATTPTTYSFAAFVSAFNLNPGGVGDKLSGSCTLTISGVVTKTYAP